MPSPILSPLRAKRLKLMGKLWPLTVTLSEAITARFCASVAGKGTGENFISPAEADAASAHRAVVASSDSLIGFIMASS